jgi:hypothetical protein
VPCSPSRGSTVEISVLCLGFSGLLLGDADGLARGEGKTVVIRSLDSGVRLFSRYIFFEKRYSGICIKMIQMVFINLLKSLSDKKIEFSHYIGQYITSVEHSSSC